MVKASSGFSISFSCPILLTSTQPLQNFLQTCYSNVSETRVKMNQDFGSKKVDNISFLLHGNEFVLIQLKEHTALSIPMFAVFFIHECVCVSESVSKREREREGRREKDRTSEGLNDLETNLVGSLFNELHWQYLADDSNSSGELTL